MKNVKILLIDDERRLSDSIKEFLKTRNTPSTRLSTSTTP